MHHYFAARRRRSSVLGAARCTLVDTQLRESDHEQAQPIGSTVSAPARTASNDTPVIEARRSIRSGGIPIWVTASGVRETRIYQLLGCAKIAQCRTEPVDVVFRLFVEEVDVSGGSYDAMPADGVAPTSTNDTSWSFRHSIQSRKSSASSALSGATARYRFLDGTGRAVAMRPAGRLRATANACADTSVTAASLSRPGAAPGSSTPSWARRIC